MEVGSLVETITSFEDERIEWGFDYPRKGDLLVVSWIEEHPNRSVRKKGIVLLHFQEKPTLPGVCDRQCNGKENFRELQPPMVVNIEMEVKTKTLIP